jgi:hypothetical protein
MHERIDLRLRRMRIILGLRRMRLIVGHVSWGLKQYFYHLQLLTINQALVSVDNV